MIQVTQRAQEQFEEFFRQRTELPHTIRVFLQEGG
jgi:Fe-S cluster assembly iron-binding protein IscA